ncbi:MAG TPA: A24 family peptidase [Clostridia bacterium]
MSILIALIGLLTGLLLNTIIHKILIRLGLKITSSFSRRPCHGERAVSEIIEEVILVRFLKISENNRRVGIFPAIICGLCFLFFHMKFGLSLMFFKTVILSSLLIIISFVDLKVRIIPNYMVIITLASGVILSCLTGASLADIILGMVTGGTILFLLSLVPNALGGGDVKLMFALGAFLGFSKTLWAIVLAFALSSVVILILLIMKAVGRRGHIPFGPFLALGSFISLMIFN